MLIDITLKLTPEILAATQNAEAKINSGHLGTHFDVMNKEFPLEYTKRDGIVFDVRHIEGRDIEADDIDLSLVRRGMFVAFCAGFVERVGYGTKIYCDEHPQLSDALIDALLEREISIIGLDFAGIRRDPEHPTKDQYCADHGVFVVENLCGLASLVEHGGRFTANTYPMSYAGLTGLPCRVIAEV